MVRQQGLNWNTSDGFTPAVKVTADAVKLGSGDMNIVDHGKARLQSWIQ
jgi:hypothetical protein